MQKFAAVGALTALLVLLTPSSRAQSDNEVERLRRENEMLKKEVAQLEKKIAQLEEDAKVKPDRAGDSKSGAGSGAKVRGRGAWSNIEFEPVKCVRDSRIPMRVIFTFSALCYDSEPELGSDTGFMRWRLKLTVRGGDDLGRLGGKVIPGSGSGRRFHLQKGVPSTFQITYEGVDEDITEFDEVEVSDGAWDARFHGIKIGAK